MIAAAGPTGLRAFEGRYRVLDLLGEGGAGAVYRVLDLREGREVALKVLHRQSSSSPAAPPAALLEQEFRVLSSLSHPNLAEVHDYGITPEGLRYFTMELIAGEDLKTAVRRELPTGKELAADPRFREIVAQTLAALDAIHTRGLVHEDLKPSNVLVAPAASGAASGAGARPAAQPAVSRPSLRVKLIDFGLARFVDRARLEVCGTMEYMAPERLRGAPGDARSDLYSLGAVLFELFTGEPPFRGATPLEVVRAQRAGALDPALAQSIPEPFRGVVERLLSPSPTDRISSAWEVLEALLGEASRSRLLPAFGTAFAGREELLAVLEEAFSAARAGQGRVVLLTGEGGIGKSRLLRELRARLQLQGARVASASAREGAKRPGDLLARILRSLRAEAALCLPPSVPPRGRASLPPSVPPRGQCSLPPSVPPTGPSPAGEEAWTGVLQDLEGDGRGSASLLSEEAARESLLHRSSELVLSLAGERPLALLVDDLQWADTLDLHFALHLLRRLEGAPTALLLVLAARNETEEDRRAVAELEGRARGRHVLVPLEVGGLSAAEVRLYLEQVLGGPGSFPEGLPEALARDTGGNPFFLEEALKLAASRGLLRREGPRWKAAADLVGETPRTVEEAIRRRLEGLGPLERDLLAWAAVLDEPAGARDLHGLAAGGTAGGAPPRDEEPAREEEPALEDVPALEEVEDALRALARAQVLARDRGRYSLLHRRVGAVVQAGLAEADRRQRHRRIAERIAAASPPGAPGWQERLAHHLFHSDRPEEAREHLLHAGSRAQRSGALREAARYLSQALEVVREPRERFTVLLQREQVWGLLGDRERQRADLAELAALAGTLGDARLEAEAMAREALHLDATGRKKECLALYERATELARAAGDRLYEARVLSRRAMVSVMLGDFERAYTQMGSAVSIARAEGDRAQEAEAHQILGVGFYLGGRYPEALMQMEEALAIRRDLGEEHRVGSLESNLGLIHLDRGDFEAAEERFRRSLKISRTIGFRRGEAVNLVNLGLVYSEMGRYERALDFMGEALRIRRELGDRWGEGADLGNLGTVYLKLGRFERAVPLIEEGLAIAREFGNKGSEGTNECRLGLVELHRGEVERARERFRRAQETARAHRLLPLDLLASTSLARAALAGREPARALEEIGPPLAAAMGSSLAHWTIDCLALKAEALLGLGKPAEALEASGEAVARLGAFRGWLERSQEAWWNHARVLEALVANGAELLPAEAHRDPGEALRLAHAHLMEKAEAIRDPELRESYLGNLGLHRAILQAHAALEEEVRREARRRERSFYEISRSINSILELEPLLDRLLDLAVETTRAEKGLILLRDTGGRLTLKAARGMAQESIADATEICQSVISDVSRRGEPILATDAAADERFRERKSIIDFRIRSLMCVPLTVRGDLLGAVYVDSRGETAFGQEDLLFLASFAHLAAIAIENARLLGRLREENLSLRREVETRYGFQNILGASSAMREVFRTMEKVARTEVTVLITGETGTGKELIARALHYGGPRRERPFVAVDCGALPENLLLSELFGHKRGAFSGAVHDRVGLFEEAEGGTIFLDEITNTTPDLQAMLLRVLQEGEIRRVGENQYKKVNVRVIAATNLVIEEAVAGGRFRQDLYYRLNVVPIRVPSLKERRDDIPLLASHFLARSSERLGREVKGFTEEAMAVLCRAPWPGNVRQLEHAIESALILTDRDRIGLEALPDLDPQARRKPRVGLDEGLAVAWTPFSFEELSLADFDKRCLNLESEYLRYLLEKADGNLSEAARLARVRNRNTLVSRLKRHGIGK